MRIFELFEAKPAKNKIVVPKQDPKNPTVAPMFARNGKGAHKGDKNGTDRQKARDNAKLSDE